VRWGLFFYRLMLGLCVAWAAIWSWLAFDGDVSPAGALINWALVTFGPLALLLVVRFLQILRQEGNAKVDALVNKALLDPELARDLLNRARSR
jgi:hypothetical protein